MPESAFCLPTFAENFFATVTPLVRSGAPPVF